MTCRLSKIMNTNNFYHKCLRTEKVLTFYILVGVYKPLSIISSQNSMIMHSYSHFDARFLLNAKCEMSIKNN